jgi:predicted protein tyrosine phosphatase
MTSDDKALRAWHRQLCPVTDWLTISGDLNSIEVEALSQLVGWQAAGITDVVDLRMEWSDEDLLAHHAPAMRYHYLGTHDNGGAQSDDWFDEGIAVYRDARARHDARLLVHCHMGINRGPSMAYAMLLEDGWDAVAALEALRQARPIAAVAYARDALRAHCRRHGRSASSLAKDLRRQQEWFDENRIDVAHVIRLIRQPTAG